MNNEQKADNGGMRVKRLFYILGAFFIFGIGIIFGLIYCQIELSRTIGKYSGYEDDPSTRFASGTISITTDYDSATLTLQTIPATSSMSITKTYEAREKPSVKYSRKTFFEEFTTFQLPWIEIIVIILLGILTIVMGLINFINWIGSQSAIRSIKDTYSDSEAKMDGRFDKLESDNKNKIDGIEKKANELMNECKGKLNDINEKFSDSEAKLNERFDGLESQNKETNKDIEKRIADEFNELKENYKRMTADLEQHRTQYAILENLLLDLYGTLEIAMLHGEFDKVFQMDEENPRYDDTRYMRNTQTFLKSLVALLSFAQIKTFDVRLLLYNRLFASNPGLLEKLKQAILNKLEENPREYEQFIQDVKYIDNMIKRSNEEAKDLEDDLFGSSDD